MRKQKTIKNRLTTLGLVLLMSIFIFAGTGAPAMAFGFPTISFTFGDIPRYIEKIFARIYTKTGAIAFQQAVRSVTYQLAQQSAVWIASGGKGRKPLIFRKTLMNALGDIGDSVVGRYIENISTGLPVNLCRPSNTKILSQIVIGLDVGTRGIDFGRDIGIDPKLCAQANQVDSKCALTTELGNACLTEKLAFIDMGYSQNQVEGIDCNTPSPKGKTECIAIPKCLEYNRASRECSDAKASAEQCAKSGNLGKRGCKLTDIKDNISGSLKNLNVLDEDFLKNTSVTFETGKNELALFGILEADVEKKKQEQIESEKADRAGTASKPVTTPITNEIKTPASAIDTQAKIAQEQSVKRSDYITGDIFVDTLYVFASTLANSYLNRLQRGFYPARSTSRGPDGELDVSGSVPSQKALLSSFSEFSPSRAVSISSPGSVDLMSEASICPPTQYQSPYNCILGEGLQAAVQQGLTVKQAVEQGQIDGNLRFPENHDPEKANLSLENLKKLRFLRVVPIGWELAAEIISSSQRQKIPFSDLIACFDKDPGIAAPPSVCNVNGSSSQADQNPLYRLVDPAWVLGLPEQFCRAEGYSSIPEHEQSPSRKQICVDLQSCIKKDSNGKCVSYGYCTREKQVWELSGKQCDGQYASCRTFTAPGDRQVSLLGKDVDASGCTNANAGCAWYSTAKNPAGVVANSADDWLTDQRIYLTSAAQACRPGDAGAREIIPLQAGVNLVRNGEFSAALLSGNPTPAEGGWNFTPQTLEQVFSSEEENISPEDARQAIKIKPYTYYTLSFDIRSKEATGAGGPAVTSGSVAVTALPGGNLRNVSFPPYDTDEIGPSFTLGLSEADDEINNSTFTRWAATFYSQGETQVEAALRGGVIFDNVQLEEITLNEGLQAARTVKANPGAGAVVLNSIPLDGIRVSAPATPFLSYLGNQKLVFADAGSCTAEESTAHTYKAARGGEQRIARVLPGDLCSSDCVGLDSFLAMPTPLELLGSPAPTPSKVNFIPELAGVCKAAEVGCEEFTNLSLSGQGQERREYYNRIESCVLETNPNIATFYTWEGTDQQGLQLKSWRLLADSTDSTGGPCASYPQGANSNPATGACQGVASCAPGEDNPNCRVFLNEAGQEKPRDITKIITASASCTEFRRTRDQQKWFFMPSEANRCSAQAQDCREYKGGRANVVQRVFLDNFESGAAGWFIAAGAPAATSGESLTAGQSSLKISAGQMIGKNLTLAGFGQGRSYNLKFLGKCASASCALNNISISGQAGGVNFNVQLGSGTLNNNWRLYEVGPALLNSPGDNGEILSMANASGVDIFIDNIELILNNDRQYFKTLSTKGDNEGGPQPAQCLPPQATFNRCGQYADENRNTFYIARFDKLFGNEALDCRSVIDTQNSDSPYAQTFNSDPSGDNPDDNFTVPADDVVYRYIRKQNLRQANIAGCTETGLPNDRDNIASWQSAFRRLDPDTFATALCRAEGLGCQEFKTGEGAKFVFRDPQNKLCAWSGDDGYFVKKNPDGTYLTDAAGDPVNCYDNSAGGPGWVGQCPDEQNTCTEYLPTNQSLGSENIYYLKNSVKTGDCSSGQDIDSGCVEFQENSSGQDKLSPAPSPKEILQVKPGRECAEWLAPTTSATIKDSRTRSSRLVNYDLGRCQAIDDTGRCLTWTGCGEFGSDGSCLRVSPNFPYAYFQGREIKTLNTSSYQLRYSGGQTLFNTGWDYSGYSIPKQYPIEYLTEVADSATGRYNLEYRGPGQFNVNTNLPLACRAFPEEDAPFSSASITRDENGRIIYDAGNRHLENLNLCEDGANCQCSYKKVSSPAIGNLYYSLNTAKSFPEDSKAVVTQTGWQGYCVEYDSETRDPNGNPECLVWLPIDSVKASPSVFENNPEAGFTSSAPLYYCLNAKGNKLGSPPANGLEFLQTKNNNYFIKLADYAVNFDTVRADPNRSDGTRMAGPLIGVEDKPSGGWFGRLWPGYVFGLAGKIFTLVQGIKSNNEVIGTGAQSNLWRFVPKANSQLQALSEFEVESIILKVIGQEAKDWPKNNEELILRREGFAASSLTNPTTKDRWTVMWCGGVGDANCEFNEPNEYKWDDFYRFIDSNDACGGLGSTDSAQDTNVWAMRAVFADGDGRVEGDLNAYRPYQFVRLEGGLCDGTPKWGWVTFDIIFQLREWCTQVAQVHSGEENKAWTGRINQKSVTSYAPVYDAGKNSFDALLNYGAKQDSPPFGAAVPPTGTIHKPEQWDTRKDESVVDEEDGSQSVETLEPGAQPLYVEVNRKQARAGSPYRCSPGKCSIPPQKTEYQPGTGDETGALNYLKQIFAKIFNFWSWDPATAKYKTDSRSEDFSRQIINPTTREVLGRCPTIQAVKNINGVFLPPVTETGTKVPDPTHFNAEAAGDCSSGRFSVFGSPVTHSAGFVPGIFRTIYVGEEMPLQFYAFNKNGEQLPLKKISIDWDSNNVRPPEERPMDITEVTGNFKNHKPSVEDYRGQDITSAIDNLIGKACSNSSPNYGDTGNACQPGVFEFKHVYQRPGIYNPAVVVEDNWGMKTTARYSGGLNNRGFIRVIARALVPPAPPVITASATSVDIPNSATISWPEIEAANRYDVYVNNTTSPVTVFTTSYTLASSIQPGPKTVVVRACNNAGCSQASNTVTVTFNETTASVPFISANPANPQVGQNPVISWNAIPAAIRYQIYVDGGSAITMLGTSYTLISPPSVGTKSVYVRACNNAGCSGNSNTLNVSFGSPAPPPALITQPTIATSNLTVNSGQSLAEVAGLGVTTSRAATFTVTKTKTSGTSSGTAGADWITFTPATTTLVFNGCYCDSLGGPAYYKAGTYTLTVRARDSAGISQTITFNLTLPAIGSDATAPTVSVTSPTGGANVSGTITLAATASDNVGVASVQFQVDGANAGSAQTNAPYVVSWNSASVANGSHAITAIARDAAGNSATSAAIQVNVSNGDGVAPPSAIQITSPADGSDLGTIRLNGALRTISIEANPTLSGLSISGNGAVMATVNQNQGFITIAPTLPEHRGSKLLTITATAADGSQDSVTVTFFVPD